MDTGIYATVRRPDDPHAVLGFCRDTLDFEVHHGAGYGGLRWIRAGRAGQRGAPISGRPVHR